MAFPKKLTGTTSNVPNKGRDTLGSAVYKTGRQLVSYNVEEPDPVTGKKQWVQKRGRREVIAAQAIWALAMKGNLAAFRLVYEIENGPAEQKVKLDAQFTHESSLLPLEMDPAARAAAFAEIVASARKRQEAAMKDVTPAPAASGNVIAPVDDSGEE